jgi:hypothetical protein
VGGETQGWANRWFFGPLPWTVLRRQRLGFRSFWRWNLRCPPGRPSLDLLKCGYMFGQYGSFLPAVYRTLTAPRSGGTRGMDHRSIYEKRHKCTRCGTGSVGLWHEMIRPIAEQSLRNGEKLGGHVIGFNDGEREGRYLLHMRAIQSSSLFSSGIQGVSRSSIPTSAPTALNGRMRSDRCRGWCGGSMDQRLMLAAIVLAGHLFPSRLPHDFR